MNNTVLNFGKQPNGQDEQRQISIAEVNLPTPLAESDST
jgi:hypothetical protein